MTISMTPTRHRKGRVAAVALTAALAMSGVAFGLTAPAAHAEITPEGGYEIAPVGGKALTGTAERGAAEGGWGNATEFGNLHLGGYRITNGPDAGTIAWCPQLGKPNPFNDQLPGETVTSLFNGSGDPISSLNLQHMNAAMARFGTVLQSPNQDAGMALAIWYFSGDIDINGVAGPGIPGFAGQNLIESGSIPVEHRAQVKAYFHEYVAQAHADVAGTATASLPKPASPKITLTADGLGASITIPAGNGTVEISGAVTADGSSTITEAGTFELTPTRPNDTTATWDITFKSSGTIDERGRIAAVTLHAEPTNTQQTIISAAGSSKNWRHTGKVTIDQTVVIEGDSKAASPIVKPGEKIQDQITLYTVDDQAWPTYTSGDKAGKPMEIPIQMTRYESNAEHVEGEIPEGAEPVEQFTYVAPGPGTYTVGDMVAEHGTHSNWVMAIDTSNADVWTADHASMKAFLPKGYQWQHTYGLERESQVVPMSVEIHTELTDDTLSSTAGDEVADVQTVSSVGSPWLTFQGEPIETVWENKVWFIPGITKDDLKQSETVPENAQLIETYESRISSSDPAETKTVKAPNGQEGVLTIQPCLVPEQMDESVRDMVEPTCEDFGVPTQSADVVKDAPVAPVKAETTSASLAHTGGAEAGAWVAAGAGAIFLGGLLLTMKRRGRDKASA